MLVLSRKADESIVFPGLGVTIHLLKLNSKVARVGIEAPPQVRVVRKELSDGSSEETFDVDTFLASSAKSREQLHVLRNQLNCINLGLQFYRQQVDAGLVEQAEKTFARVIENLRLMETQLDHQVEQAKSNESNSVASAERPIQVLLVEDDPSQRELLAGVLGMRGFEVATACSGNEALGYFKTHDEPDFVLMDMRMPEGDGPSTIRSLRKLCADRSLKILATSGTEPQDVGLKAGFDRWFPKPIDTDGLVQFMTRSHGSTVASVN